MTSRDDATRAAVAPILADLRGELLVMPREHIAERHLDMMTFEQQVLATPRFVETKRRRTALSTPRRAAVAFICAISTVVSCGLSAAGALPEPLQNITESIAHTLGVPKADHAQDAPRGHSAGTPSTPRPTPDATPKATAPTTAPAPPAPEPAPTTSPATTPTTAPLVLPGPETQIAKTPAHPPAQPITPIDSGPTPTKNSSNTPPGYPTDWREQATEAAAHQLQACANAAAVSPVGCPQSTSPVGDNAQIQSISWKLLNIPQDGAAVTAKTQPGNPRKRIAPSTTVTVYEAFQMSALYTEVGGAAPYLAYSSGIGIATMTWNGTNFVNVSFIPGSVAGQLPVGLIAPTIPESESVDNGIVLAALQAGFDACTVTAPPTATDPIPSCPQPAASGAGWTSVTNPAAGAHVSYSARTGLYTVSGTYAMTSDQGEGASGPYTATMFFDGFRIWVLDISAS